LIIWGMTALVISANGSEYLLHEHQWPYPPSSNVTLPRNMRYTTTK
jgi:hypothetical protein